MNTKRKIEIFTAGCPICEEIIKLVNGIVCSSCEVAILDMNDSDVSKRAKHLGINKVPAVAINGKLADCCVASGVDEVTLKASGIGVA